MGNQDLFSLVAPLYQTEAFLKTFLDSVVTQDYKFWELFIVADGPSTNSQELVASYKDKRIHYVEIEHGGACKARNAGKALAKGTYIAFPSTDFKLHPGCLRQWKYAFQEHPDADFVYGGYRFMQNGKDMFDFNSQPFDLDQLKVRNYIDGGFPIKREKCPEWDESLVSLNDWDFWLTACIEMGLNGHYMAHEGKPVITYAAEIPRKEGLSEDSSRNWIERNKTIKAKHGIPSRETNVFSLGAPFHGLRTAKLMGADFQYTDKPHEYKTLYLLGWYFEHFKQNVMFFKHSTKQETSDSRNVVHWIGSDVTGLYNLKVMEMKEIIGLFDHLKITHLAECEWMKDELEQFGIKVAGCLPLPVQTEIEMSPLPETFTVGVYAPMGDDNTKQKYHIEFMHQIQRSMPDVEFVFFGTPDVGQQGNETHVGYVPVQKAIDMCSINLRITEHDGLPMTPVEFMIGGREVITSVPLTHAHYIEQGDYAEVRESIIAKIREIQRHPRSPEDRKLISDYWREQTSPATFRDKFDALTLQKEVAHVA